MNENDEIDVREMEKEQREIAIAAIKNLHQWIDDAEKLLSDKRTPPELVEAAKDFLEPARRHVKVQEACLDGAEPGQFEGFMPDMFATHRNVRKMFKLMGIEPIYTD